jgi:hypothetical protein
MSAMMANERKDSRKTPRSLVQGHVEVDLADSRSGGRLHDMSVGGASILFGDGVNPAESPVEVDDEILLVIRGRAHMPGRVVRVFNDGFAVEFDWSLDIGRDRFTVKPKD